MFFNPAFEKSSAIKPGGEQRYIPGAPAAGGVNCSIVIIVCVDVETQKFFSGIFHTEATIRHPGFKTRIISLKARFISGNKLKPNRQVMAVNFSFAKMKLSTNAQNIFTTLITRV